MILYKISLELKQIWISKLKWQIKADNKYRKLMLQNQWILIDIQKR